MASDTPASTPSSTSASTPEVKVYEYVQGYITGVLNPECSGYCTRINIDTKKVIFEGNLKLGYLDGYAKLYNENGVLIKEGHNIKGRLIKGQLYESDGKPLADGEFDAKNGLLINGKLYNAGVLEYEINVIDDNRYNGTKFRTDGTISAEGTFNRLMGVICQVTGRRYHSDGILASEGNYFVDKLSEGKMYNKSGVLQYEGRFNTCGLIVGKEYYPSGALKSDGSYRNGLPHGKCKLYEENGQLRYNGEFESGKYHGEGILYSLATGKIIQEGRFKNGLFTGHGFGEKQITLDGKDQHIIHEYGNFEDGVLVTGFKLIEHGERFMWSHFSKNMGHIILIESNVYTNIIDIVRQRGSIPNGRPMNDPYTYYPYTNDSAMEQ